MKSEYKYVRLYNKKNSIPLYGIEVKSCIFDGLEVFLTEDDRETWFNDFLDSVEGLGLSFTYTENLTRNDGIYEMYEKASTLKITRGKVYIG